MAHIDRTTTMEDAFEEPKKGKIDGEEYEVHSLPDQIAMDKYLATKDVGTIGGAKSKNFGVALRKIIIPGASS